MDHDFIDCKTLASRNVEDASGIAAVRGSIAERRAAKCGFNAERISTARFRTTSPLASPAATAVRSPCITIPPGISPTALLDSPILLPNSQLSPTTGTFPLGFLDFDNSVLNAASMFVESSLRQKPHENSDSLLGFSSLQNQGNGGDFQDPALGEQSMDFEFPADFCKKADTKNCIEELATDAFQDPALGEQWMDFEFPADFCKKADTKNCIEELATDAKVVNAMVTDANLSDVQMSCPNVASNRPSLPKEQVNGDNTSSHYTLEEHNRMFPATGSGRTSEDGYNWRKYGQKQVKGSEYPRSYYKCTHPNCLVKKKIESSHDGQITEIIYKGAHNHPKPQPSRRTQLGSSSALDEMPETDRGSGISVKVEGGSAWKDMESGRADGLERTSSASVVTELSDPLSATQGKSVGTFESADTPELSSTLASRDDDEEEDQATQGSVSLGVDANDEESDSKRRKIEGCYLETNLVSRAVREPRVVVQIESEVDILDDGYRWRKYGQKVVKGNPNPRSYYKCTSAGCLVRKHVERASHDLKYVITTYEGKHNHEVPTARNSTNVNTSSVNLNQVTANQQPPLLARNSTVPKPEIQLQHFIPGFDRKSMFHNDYFGTNFPRNCTSDLKLGTSSIYPMKFPSMQSTMPYGSFGFNSNCGAGNLSGSISSLVPEFQILLPMSLHTSSSLPLAGADFSNNGNSVGQVQAFLPGQPLIRPKQEQKDDSSYDDRMSGIDHVYASS